MWGLKNRDIRINQSPTTSINQIFWIGPYQFDETDPTVLKNYFVISTIRNPLDRFISGWKYCVLRGKLNVGPITFLKMLQDGHQFNDFVRVHLALPQTHYLYRDGQLLADSIIQMEKYSKIVPLMAELGLPDFPVLELNVNQTDPRPTQHFIDEYPELVSLHYQVFKADWDLLPYSTPT